MTPFTGTLRRTDNPDVPDYDPFREYLGEITTTVTYTIIGTYDPVAHRIRLAVSHGDRSCGGGWLSAKRVDRDGELTIDGFAFGLRGKEVGGGMRRHVDLMLTVGGNTVSPVIGEVA